MSTAQRTSLNKESPDVVMQRSVGVQAGVISRQQLVAAGFTNQQIHRRAAKGILVRVLPRVYRHLSVPETWMQRLWAAQLWADGRALISHETAGALWRLDGCAGSNVSLTTAAALQSPAPWLRIHRVRDIPSHHVTQSRGLALTTPTRTILDLAGTLSEEDLEAALDCALRRGSTSLSRLEAELAGSGRGSRGRKKIRRLLHDRSAVDSPTHSVLETRFRRLLKRHGLPIPVQQQIVRRQQGCHALVDFVYPKLNLAIEVDGYSFHGSRRSWQADLHRQNDLVLAGFRVLRFTWSDVCEREQEIAATLRSFFHPSLPLGGDS